MSKVVTTGKVEGWFLDPIDSQRKVILYCPLDEADGELDVGDVVGVLISISKKEKVEVNG